MDNPSDKTEGWTEKPGTVRLQNLGLSREHTSMVRCNSFPKNVIASTQVNITACRPRQNSVALLMKIRQTHLGVGPHDGEFSGD